MKRQIATAAALLIAIVSQPVAAQRAPVRLGASVGANFAKFRGDDGGLQSNRVGAIGGVALTLPLGGMLDLEIDGLYSQKGTKFDAVLAEATTKLDYIDIPVLLRVGLIPNSPTRPYIEAGPSLSIRVGCAVEAKSFGFGGSVDCSEAGEFLEGQVKSYDIGGVIGGGIDIAAGSARIKLGVRYTIGFVEIVEHSTVKNQAISAMVGFSVPLGK
jgi:hypothetical protein